MRAARSRVVLYSAAMKRASAPFSASLRTSASLGVSAYDARFLAAARALGVKLVTEDARLRRAAPELTQSLTAALAG